jgi:hypothetical protein
VLAREVQGEDWLAAVWHFYQTVEINMQRKQDNPFPSPSPSLCKADYFGQTFLNHRSGFCIDPNLTQQQALAACRGQPMYGVQGMLPIEGGSLACLIQGKRGKVGRYGISCQQQHPKDPSVSVWCTGSDSSQ